MYDVFPVAQNKTQSVTLQSLVSDSCGHVDSTS